jgi:heptosyltransferase I
MRILLIRTSALGDVVHCLPVLTEIRRYRPDAEIAWVVEQAMAPVLEGHPGLDRVIVARLRPWRRDVWGSRREIAGFIRELRGFRADMALDLMGNHKGGIIARFSGARRRIGLGRGARREEGSAMWINEPVAPLGSHAVDLALSLAPHVSGMPVEPERVDFGGEKLFPDAPAADLGEPYLLVTPGAGWGNKVYPPAWWGRVAELLRRSAGLSTRVAVAPGEEHLAGAVVAASAGAAREEPAFGLPRLAALLRGASLVLGGDTGPIHLAHALGAPVLCVMGPTDPERHGPYGAPERALAVVLPCSFCYKRFGEAKACLLSLPPERVAERAAALLSSQEVPNVDM